jgi:hypothetical protein
MRRGWRFTIRASPTDVVYRLCAKKDASLARGRLIVLQQGLQTGALKQSAWQNAISGTIYSALKSARGKHTTRTHTPKTIYFLEPQCLEHLQQTRYNAHAVKKTVSIPRAETESALQQARYPRRRCKFFGAHGCLHYPEHQM